MSISGMKPPFMIEYWDSKSSVPTNNLSESANRSNSQVNKPTTYHYLHKFFGFMGLTNKTQESQRKVCGWVPVLSGKWNKLKGEGSEEHPLRVWQRDHGRVGIN